MNKTQYIEISTTLIIGVIGGFVAFYLGMPAPFLVGPVIAVTIGCFSGLKLLIPTGIRDICFIVLGLSMGAGATPKVLETAQKWPLSFIMLAFVVYAIMFFGAAILQKIFGFKPRTALLAATPGHLSFVIALSEDVKADTQKIALVQSIRMLALTIILPLVLKYMDLGLPARNMPIVSIEAKWLFILFFVTLLAGFVLKKFKMPAAYLIAGMVISTFTHLTSLVEGVTPQSLVIPSFIILGCLIGTRFNGANLQTVKQVLIPSVVNFLSAFSVAAIGALIVYWVTGLPYAQIIIAFTPGGVEAMIAMSLLLNADPTFVAAHHILRLFILAALLPWMIMRISKSDSG